MCGRRLTRAVHVARPLGALRASRFDPVKSVDPCTVQHFFEALT